MTEQQSQVIQVDFSSRGKLKAISPGVYQYERQDKSFYCRPVVDGRQRIYKLKSITKRAAEIEWGKLRAELAQYHAGLAKNPFALSDAKTIRDLCQFYLDAGCPYENVSKRREGKYLDQEIARAKKIIDWPGSRNPAGEMNAEQWANYRDWRRKNLERANKGGDRAVDIERSTLSNIFRNAVRNQSKTGITRNPMAHEVPRYRDPKDIVHCRDRMPRSADELDSLAAVLQQDRRSEVLMWQMLMECFVGQRSHEIVRLRWDAQDKTQPGFIQGNKLYLFRSLTHKGTYGHIEIHGALRDLIEAMKAWRSKRCPESPWFFPSPRKLDAHILPDALTRRLSEITPVLQLPSRSSHGMRAYYVNVRRSQGWSDDKIALHIGHTTRGKLIVDVYGEGLDYALHWLPAEKKPCWFTWLPEDTLPQPVQLDLL